jgi:hypothetical protein
MKRCLQTVYFAAHDIHASCPDFAQAGLFFIRFFYGDFTRPRALFTDR